MSGNLKVSGDQMCLLRKKILIPTRRWSRGTWSKVASADQGKTQQSCPEHQQIRAEEANSRCTCQKLSPWASNSPRGTEQGVGAEGAMVPTISFHLQAEAICW